MSKQKPLSRYQAKVQNPQLLEQLLPVVTAADAGREGWARVWFDDHISRMIEDHAEQRSLSDATEPDRDYRNHLLGFAAEVAVATWRNGSVDTRVFGDYEGDNGVDVRASARWGSGVDRIQVKSTREVNEPERTIARKEVSNIDYAVLASSKVPEQYVDIVGYTSRPILKLTSDVHGKEGPLLHQEMLHPMDGQRYDSDDVRQSTGVMH